MRDHQILNYPLLDFAAGLPMKIGQYTFNCRFTTQALLPYFKGSTLRGGFGLALKKISCALRQQKCDACLLSETCAYAYLFEVEKARHGDGERQRFAHRPHPYLLFSPDEQKRQFEIDDSLIFQITLFGRANEYLPHVFYAVNEMGKRGLGKKSQMPGEFEIRNVEISGKTIFSGGELNTKTQLTELSLQPQGSPGDDKSSIDCITPLRLKHTNKFQAVLPFHLIVRAALRRISSLEEAYGDGEPDLDYKGLSARAENVKTVSADCHWVEFERYSSRQRSVMKFGGVRGGIIYSGEDLPEFLPLLHYCEMTHLGKQTSFGLGKIKVKSWTG
ncbi:MAG: CRISPR system precrRNA processing endoribonuclease RAMP protein Cas6 [Desulfamplus sp.]|nr:CRISPR system precrRNA processing endoribonuclease RAMP protein Cas6 [Desulfamplus sp.]